MELFFSNIQLLLIVVIFYAVLLCCLIFKMEFLATINLFSPKITAEQCQKNTKENLEKLI